MKDNPQLHAAIIMIVFFVSIGVFLFYDCSGSDTKQNVKQDLRIEAYNFSQDLIKNHLKSPGTAVFPPARTIGISDLGNNRFYINGYVESQNGFGAQIRTRYDCWVIYRQNQRVEIEKITFKE